MCGTTRGSGNLERVRWTRIVKVSKETPLLHGCERSSLHHLRCDHAMRVGLGHWLPVRQAASHLTVLRQFGFISSSSRPGGRTCAAFTRQHHASTATSTSTFHSDYAPSSTDRQLFRALLRECTYFADPHAAQWARLQILSRFRDSQFRTWDRRDDGSAVQGLLARNRARARRQLHLLQRANSGDQKAVLKVLLFAYGRRGKRRRELMQALLQHADACTDLESASLRTGSDSNGTSMPSHQQKISMNASQDDRQNTSGSHTGVNEYMPAMNSQLRALAISQNTMHFRHLSGLRVRPPGQLRPVIPELNSWFRPMPKCRVKNMTRSWYALFLDKLLPPLPLKEWLHLHDLATGRNKFPGQPPRRPGIHEKLDVLSHAIRFGKFDRKTTEKSSTGVTSSAMRRRWTETFSVSPVISWDVMGQKWTVCWGQQALNDASLVEPLRCRYEGRVSNGGQ